jgi:hypothetical protein
MFGGTMGCIAAVLVATILAVGLVIGGCALLVGSCAVGVPAIEKAQQAADKAAADARAREATGTPGTPGKISEPKDVDQPVPELRMWTDNTGNHTVEAEFIDVTAGVVKLRKANGKITTLPLERLSKADRKWIRDREQK